MSLDFVFDPIIEDTVITTKQIFKADTGFDGNLNEFKTYPVLTLMPYSDPILDTEFTTKIYVDILASSKAPINNPSFTGSVSGITKDMVGLSNVDNTSDASKPISTAQQSALDLKAPLESPAFTGTITGITKAMVGLSNVDNTNDASKPISSATQSAIDLKASIDSPAFTGVATFNSFLPTSTVNPNGSTQLVTKGYVDAAVANVINSAPEALNTLNELSLALGDDPNFATTVSTNIGLKAPLESPAFTGTITGITKAMVGLSNADNTSDSLKPVSTAQQTALDLKANTASPALTGVPTAPTATTTDNSTQVATTAYVKSNLSSYQPTLSGSSNITVGTLACSALTASSLITSTIFTENLISVSPNTNVYTLNFASGNVFYSASNPTGNFTVNLTNIPTSSSTKQFTISLIVNTGTFICSLVSAVDTTPTTIVATNSVPKYSGGVAPTVGTSSIVVHTFTIIQCFATKQIIYSASAFN